MTQKNKMSTIYFAFISAALILMGPVMLNAAEFSADMIQSAGGRTFKGRVFVKGDDFRREMNMQGRTHTMIFRKDSGKLWMVMPENHMYMEMGSQAAGMPGTDPDKLSESAEKKYLGKETVNGYVCDKYRYVSHNAAGGTTLIWMSRKLKFPVKTVSEGKSGRVEMEYRNIKEGKQPASLFRVPKGYRKMSMPGMPGMRR